ncbi:MAG: GUN4 domain-containing protein [Cyanobacteria bacterium SBLK]|nr:GUN4 domain-containing protein [Cyanobacteria bacterium SBLK]
METGAADRDGDGKIHACELHEYAKGKVNEAKPKQKPAIISDREGYNILLSYACLDNPELDFRKSVEKYVYEGCISKIGDRILKIQCQKLGIDRERAKKIIDEVLESYRQRRENIEHYREILQEVVEQDYPLNERQQGELQDLQNILGLEDKDVKGVKEQVLNAKSSLSQETPETRRLQSEKSSISPEVELNGEKGIDYTKLRDLLATRQWKEADKETERVMLQAADRTENRYLRGEDIARFPCKDLRTIDRLWVHYSKGKFGLSIQKKIYEELGGTRDYNKKVWIEVCDRMGWRKNEKWLKYSDLTFDQNNDFYSHLPALVSFGGYGGQGWVVGKRLSSLVQRLVTCNINLF